MAAVVERLSSPTVALGTAQSAGSLVVVPQNFGEVMAFADRMAESNFVPAHLRKRPADCLAVAMQALRWEMDPFMVAQKTYFTREGAPPGYEAQLVAAVVYSRAPLEGRLDIAWSGAWPDRVCSVTGRFRNDAHPKTRHVAARGLTTRNSPLWKSDPDQQLAYYAIRAWARLYCPDVLMGVYTRDEINAGYHAEGAMVDVTPAADAPTPSKLDALEGALGTVEEETEDSAGADGVASAEGSEPEEATQATAAPSPAPASRIVEQPALIPTRADADGKIDWPSWLADAKDALSGAPGPDWISEWLQVHAATLASLKGRSAKTHGLIVDHANHLRVALGAPTG